MPQASTRPSSGLEQESQNLYAPLYFQKQHHDKDILKAQQWIEANILSRPNMADVAWQHGMSVRNFIRRFKTATGDAPV